MNSNPKPSPNRRRKLLIYPQFQLRYLVSSLGGSLAVISICFFANHLFFRHFERRGHDGGLPADHIFFQFLAEQRHFMAMVLVGVAVVTTVCLTVYGLVLSHRMAGPLHRLRRYLEEEIQGNGNAHPLKFRDGDYFVEIADLVNQALAKKKSPPRSGTDG